MFCPDDGESLGPKSAGGDHAPCRKCGVSWQWNSEDSYLGAVTFASLNTVADALKQAGTEHHALGIDALVGSIIEALEKEARDKGQSTYYTGTYAVGIRNYGLIHAGLTCECIRGSVEVFPFSSNSLRWTSFMGNDWEAITRIQAMDVLIAESS